MRKHNWSRWPVAVLIAFACAASLAPRGCVPEVQVLRPVATIDCMYAARGEGAPHEILRQDTDEDFLYAKTPFSHFRVRLDGPVGVRIAALEVVMRQRATVRHPVVAVAPKVRLYVDGDLHSEVADYIIREPGFRDYVHEFRNLGRVESLEVEVEAWAVGWMSANGTEHDVTRLEARAYRRVPSP